MDYFFEEFERSEDLEKSLAFMWGKIFKRKLELKSNSKISYNEAKEQYEKILELRKKSDKIKNKF